MSFKFGTFSALKAGLAAVVGVAALAGASQASATSYVKLLSSSMNKTFQANISGDGNVYSNGITFSVKDYVGGTTVGDAYDLFGFCVDVFHNITIGNLGYVYTSNEDLSITDPLPTDFGGHTIDDTTLTKLTNLIDTGYALHQQELDAGVFDFDTEMRLAAIQAAIWKVEVPSKTVNVIQAGLSGANFSTYQGYFNDYVNGNFTPLNDADDRFYVIADGTHQSFAIGWPIDAVPEPGTWALMIGGFGLVGGALRRRRTALAAA